MTLAPVAARGTHSACHGDAGLGDFSFKKETMALTPEQTSPFQPVALCFNSCKVFCCFLSLIDQYPGQTGLKPQNQILAT